MSIESCSFEVSPYDQSGSTKQTKRINVNYTNQDFWSMKSRLVDFINERFGPNGTELPNSFNDFVESSLAIMLIENFAFLADTLSFKQDQQFNEIFIDSVTEIENAFRIAKEQGFQPQPPIAARSLWAGTINTVLATDLTISTPVIIDVVANDVPITIELFAANSDNTPLFDEDIIISSGSLVNTSIIGLEGRTISEQFSGDGEVNQSLQLNFTPVIWDSIRVDVDGSTWTQVEYFTDSQRRKEFRVEFDSDYNGFVIFGNNRAGMIPTRGSLINVTYRIGGGIRGNIVTGFVEIQKQASVPGLGFSLPVTFRNYTKGEYGYDGDTIDDIRRKLPVWNRTQNRAVTGNDYKTVADSFVTPYYGQVGKSTAVLRNNGCSGNIIDIYILAKDGENSLTTVSNELKVALNEEFDTKKMITDHVCLKDGVIITADISIDITLDKTYRKFELELKENVNRRISDFFSLNNWEYGKQLKDVDIIKELSDFKQFDNIEVTLTTNDEDNSGSLVIADYYEIIRPDTITITLTFE